MAPRKDGIETRRRILDAACAIFAEKGYRDATVAEICAQAEANQAAVNYHFRDKDSLYVEVWRHCAGEEAQLYPFDGGVAPNAGAGERLRGIVASLVLRMGDQGKLGRFQKLKSMEMANPTGLLAEVMREFREPLRDRLKQVIRDILGSRANEQEVLRCERSVVGQCLVVKDSTRPPFSKGAAKPLPPRENAHWIDHITRFSMAGIRSLRESKPAMPRSTRVIGPKRPRTP